MQNQNFKDEINAYRQEFYKLYIKDIKPVFERMEQERLDTLKSSRKSAAKAFLVALAGIMCFALWCVLCCKFFVNEFLLSIFFLIGLIVFLGIIAMFASAYAIGTLTGAYDDFSKKLKTIYLNEILKIFGNFQWCEDKAVIPESELVQCGLFSKFNILNVYDTFIGNYRGVPFSISETELIHKTKKSNISCFSGVIIKIKSNKDTKFPTIVTPNKDLDVNNNNSIIHAYFNVLFFLPFFLSGIVLYESWSYLTKSLFPIIVSAIVFIVSMAFILIARFVITTNNKNTQQLKLEDIVFDKQYKVLSDDQVEARYLVTPAFMERFKNIKTTYGSDNVKCAFYEDNLMFAISTDKDLFELGSLNRPLNNQKYIDTLFNELIAIYLLIDYFKLDENTGL